MRSIVGQIAWNAAKIKSALDKAAKENVDLLVTPELAIMGYPADDLLSFQFILKQEADTLQELASYTLQSKVALLVGHIEVAPGGWFYNAASLYENGQCLGTIRKERLATYNIFNEARQFVAYSEDQRNILFRGKKLGIVICEDDWDEVDAYGNLFTRKHSLPGPATKDERKHCDIHINLSASPFEVGKTYLREKAFSTLSKKLGVPFLWVNRVGAQDSALFDGQSSVYTPELTLEGKAFEEDFLIWDSSKKPTVNHNSTENTVCWHELQEALCMGIRDFVRQSGSQGVLLGLSGGIDSACVAALCAQALGSENVYAYSLPSKLTSDLSKRLARELAQKLGIHFKELSIDGVVGEAAKLLDLKEASLAIENLQSRARGLLLMGESNKTGHLLMACGNKSEYAVGYGTLYGDIAGALAPIGDLLKTEVYGLCHFMNRDDNIFANVFSQELLLREPTAELAPNQKDSDSLPHYALLDTFLHELIVRQGKAFVDHDWTTFFKTTSASALIQKVQAAEFKRYQVAPILRVSNWSFGRSWSMPIATRTF